MTKLKSVTITIGLVIVALLPGTMVGMLLISLIYPKSREKIFHQFNAMKGGTMDRARKITKIVGSSFIGDKKLAKKVDPSQIDADRVEIIDKAFAYLETQYDNRASAWGIGAVIFAFMIGAVAVTSVWVISGKLTIG